MKSTESPRANAPSRSSCVRASAVVTLAALTLAACGSSGSSATPGGGTTIQSSTNSAAASGTPIKIGNIGHYSGFSGDTTAVTELALQAWSKDVNAKGGIDGHPVEVIVKDDGGLPAQAVVAVKQLVEQDHVVALVGNHEAGVDAAWASYADAHHIPVVGGVATGSPYSTDPNFFPVTDSGLTGSIGYPNAAKLFGKKSVTVAYCAEFPACAQAAALMKRYAAMLAVQYVPGQGISGSAPNYTAQCQKFKSAGAESIFLASDLNTADRFAQQCSQLDYRPLYIDNPQNWKPSEDAKPEWDGLVLASDAPLWFGNGPGTADFLTGMSKYAPSIILDSSTTSGWYAGKVFEQALKGATGAITSQSVYDGLYKLGPNFDLGGILAPVTYTKGKVAVQQLCTWFALVKGGKETTPDGANRVCVPSP
jgi:branched-chain amino acid transport system substrate-binding protein